MDLMLNYKAGPQSTGDAPQIPGPASLHTGAPEPLVEDQAGQLCGIHFCKYSNPLPCVELGAQSV
jgi:hypothetical protein